MNVSARSYVAAGIAALTAGVIAIPTTIESLAAPTTLSASVQKERVALLAAARSFTAPIPQPVAFVVIPSQHAGAPNAVIKALPTAATEAAAPAAQAALAGFPGIQSAIINAYNVINPWVDYGVNVAQYAVGWIPVVGIFAPQIGIFYYDLIEPIATSAIFNTAYVLGGSIGLVQGISNVINDSINAGIGFVNAQISWALSFLPPLPPIPFAAAQTTALKVAAAPTARATAEAADATVATPTEAAAKPAADPTEPEAPKTPTQQATETGTAKPATEVVNEQEPEPVKKPEPTTTETSGGVAAQGEVRGGTQSATDPKNADAKPDDKTPSSKPDADKPDADGASTASKPADSSPSGTKTDAKDGDKSGGSDKSVGSAQGA
jgi:hypothetical protein